MDTKVNERVKPTFRTKPILGRREQLYGHMNAVIRAMGEILISRWKSTVEKEPEIPVNRLDPVEVSLIPE